MLDKESDTTKKPFTTPTQLIIISIILIPIAMVIIQDWLPFLGNNFYRGEHLEFSTIKQVEKEGSDILIIEVKDTFSNVSQPGQIYICRSSHVATCDNSLYNSWIYPVISSKINKLAFDEVLILVERKKEQLENTTESSEFIVEVPLSDRNITKVFFGNKSNLLWKR